MTGSAYRELERTLEELLIHFSKTKQKLNRFERTRRDRVATILGAVAKKRQQQEQSRSALIPDLSP